MNGVSPGLDARDCGLGHVLDSDAHAGARETQGQWKTHVTAAAYDHHIDQVGAPGTPMRHTASFARRGLVGGRLR